MQRSPIPVPSPSPSVDSLEIPPSAAPVRPPTTPPRSPSSRSSFAAGRARRRLYRTLQPVVGSGSQGVVRLAVGPPGVCAIKAVETLPGDADAAEMVRRMRAVFAIRPHHPGVVRLLDFFRTSGKAYFVHEYCAGGDLALYLERHAGAIGEEEARNIAFAILSALRWLHAHGVVHRDVKPANVLLRDSSRPAETLCLADFGSSFVDGAGEDEDGSGRNTPGEPDSPVTLFSAATSPNDRPNPPLLIGNQTRRGSSSSITAMQTLAGTPFYLPPEIIRGLPYGPGVDMWSLGCIVYELLFGRHPFQVVGSFQELYSRIGRADYELPPDRPISPQAACFIRSLLIVDPESRMSAEDAASHPWMAGASPPNGGLPEEGYAVTLNELGELVLADVDASHDSTYLSRKGS
ncbi:kinase-like domain-containing protein [Hyaloraphidium curvatum]|nr:kinase-like domain-containing protein [Hyaloraphidium curvatum]